MIIMTILKAIYGYYQLFRFIVLFKSNLHRAGQWGVGIEFTFPLGVLIFGTHFC